ncbi:MAG: ribosome silencing factor [Planctomycetota bacterium]|jgi:ribosome-associated protein
MVSETTRQESDADLGPFESESARFACHAARMLIDSRCEDGIVLDVRQLSQVADYFVMATGTSERQIQSMAEDLKALARLEDNEIFGHHGREAARWLVVDCVDVVVHLFDEETRAYYDLESLWADAPRLDWESVTKPGQFADLHRTAAPKQA